MPRPRENKRFLTLTPREQEVIALRNLGMTNEDIATQLDMTRTAVKNAVYNAMEKIRATATETPR